MSTSHARQRSKQPRSSGLGVVLAERATWVDVCRVDNILDIHTLYNGILLLNGHAREGAVSQRLTKV
jgi:hypothetical protein